MEETRGTDMKVYDPLNSIELVKHRRISETL